MLTLGFTGAPGVGKDTAFEIIRNRASEAGLMAKRYSFADPIREIGDRILSLPAGHKFWDHPQKEIQCAAFSGHTPREFLIDLGMLGRKYRPNVWCDLVFEQISRDCMKSQLIPVITDVRFENEARALQAAGGRLIEIIRPGHDYDPERISESGQAAKCANIRVSNHEDMEGFCREIEALLWSLIASRNISKAGVSGLPWERALR